MAVHTSLSNKQLAEILGHYDLGSFKSASAISDGIENSNYFLSTSQGEYVLTLFEEIPTEELSPYLDLLIFSKAQGIKVAAPLLTRAKHSFIQLNNLQSKPCIISPRLKGHHLNAPTSTHRQLIAIELATFHKRTSNYLKPFNGIRSLDWLIGLANQYQGDNKAVFLDNILQFQQLALPKTMTHGDLFTDNCLFNGNELSGIIDFFNAGFGTALLDLAILTCAWCKTPQHSLDIDAALDILTSYSSIRQLTNSENNNLLLTLRVAAIRFYLSRTFSPSIKKPEEFRLLFEHLNSLSAKDLHL